MRFEDGMLTRSHGRPVIAILLLLTGLLPVIAALSPGVAVADTVILPKDKDGHVAIHMTSADGGVSGKLSVVNPNDNTLTIVVHGSGAIAPCTFDSATVPPLSTADVVVKSDKCDLGTNGGSATMTVTGKTSSTVNVQLQPQAAAQPVSLGASLCAFLVVAAGSLGLLVVCWVQRPGRSNGTGLHLDDDLPGLPAGWTFKDSWATNVGAVSTAFVAIFGTKDAVKALVGAESDSLQGRLLIIAAVSALLIGIAPVVLKAIGPRSTATALGVLVAGWLTTAAVGGQVLAVYTAFEVGSPTGAAWRDFANGFGINFPLFVAAALLALLGWYVYGSMNVLLTPPVHSPPEPSEELLSASATLVAAQVCCKEGQEPGSDGHLLDIAYVQAVNHLQRLRSLAAKAQIDDLRQQASQQSEEARSKPGVVRTAKTRRGRRLQARALRLESAGVAVPPAGPVSGAPGESEAPYTSLDAIVALRAQRPDTRSALL